MPVIKRYSNRKLYDSETRRYVTLEEVAQMIRRGEDVEVVDHLTGIDLTAVTMAQIIFEQEKKFGGFLPRIVLSRMIKSGTKTMRELQSNIQAFLDPEMFFRDELERRLKILQSQQDVTEDEMSRLLEQLMASYMKRDNQPVEIDDEDDAATLEDFQSLMKRITEIENELQAISKESN